MTGSRGQSSSIHRVARGYSAAADTYERARPEYPQEAVAWLAEELGIGPGRTVVDVAAGTGKLTRMLAATGARVIAVEPVAEMRAKIRGAEALDGTAEELPLADGSADAITAAQAFHWFDAPRALAEFARVLRPGGGVGLIWNLRDLRDPLQQAVEELLHPYMAPVRDQWEFDLDAAFAASDHFGALERFELPFEQSLDADGLVERVASTSFVSIQPDEERAKILARARALGEAREAPFPFPYITQAFVSVRRR